MGLEPCLPRSREQARSNLLWREEFFYEHRRNSSSPAKAWWRLAEEQGLVVGLAVLSQQLDSEILRVSFNPTEMILCQAARVWRKV